VPDPGTIHDWRETVRERLDSQVLPFRCREEIIAELAAHLEETYDHARSRGLGNQAAFELAIAQIRDAHRLAKAIRRAKSAGDSMNFRTRSLWLPALITLLGASVSLTLSQLIGVQPRLVWIGPLAMSFYWPWLATLPVFGALGAYLSRRALGPAPARLAAGLSPALVMLIVMCLILPWGLAIDGVSFFRLVSFGLGLANWVALPAVALLLGALPFLRASRPAQA
jgi:hypothetical protein